MPLGGDNRLRIGGRTHRRILLDPKAFCLKLSLDPCCHKVCLSLRMLACTELLQRLCKCPSLPVTPDKGIACLAIILLLLFSQVESHNHLLQRSLVGDVSCVWLCVWF